jgi:precorrin-3B methylase
MHQEAKRINRALAREHKRARTAAVASGDPGEGGGSAPAVGGEHEVTTVDSADV